MTAALMAFVQAVAYSCNYFLQLSTAAAYCSSCAHSVVSCGQLRSSARVIANFFVTIFLRRHSLRWDSGNVHTAPVELRCKRLCAAAAKPSSRGVGERAEDLRFSLNLEETWAARVVSARRC